LIDAILENIDNLPFASPIGIILVVLHFVKASYLEFYFWLQLLNRFIAPFASLFSLIIAQH
jgi:hypothetical protein